MLIIDQCEIDLKSTFFNGGDAEQLIFLTCLSMTYFGGRATETQWAIGVAHSKGLLAKMTNKAISELHFASTSKRRPSAKPFRGKLV